MKNFQHFVDAVLAGSPPAGEEIIAGIHTLPDGEARHRRKIINELAQHPPQGGPLSVHVGVAGYFNLEIACKTRPDYLLLVDGNSQQTKFWQELFALIKNNQTVEMFADELQARTCASGFICADGEVLSKRLGSEKAMLGLEMLLDADNYAYLHQLAVSRHVASTTINLVADAKRAQALGKAMRAEGLQVDTAYWSNIGSFFHATRHASLRSKDDDVYGTTPSEFVDLGLHYKNIGFYKADQHNQNLWSGYGSQEERNAIADTEIPAYERFLENTSALGGLNTLHMHTHAGDKIRHIHRYPLILSEGPLRRLPEQIEVRKNSRDPNHPDWQARIGDGPESGPKTR